MGLSSLASLAPTLNLKAFQVTGWVLKVGPRCRQIEDQCSQGEGKSLVWGRFLGILLLSPDEKQLPQVNWKVDHSCLAESLMFLTRGVFGHRHLPTIFCGSSNTILLASLAFLLVHTHDHRAVQWWSREGSQSEPSWLAKLPLHVSCLRQFLKNNFK